MLSGPDKTAHPRSWLCGSDADTSKGDATMDMTLGELMEAIEMLSLELEAKHEALEYLRDLVETSKERAYELD